MYCLGRSRAILVSLIFPICHQCKIPSATAVIDAISSLQSPRADKVPATPPPTISSSSQRHEGSSERRHVITSSHGSDRDSRDRERDRNDRMPRTASHASLVSDRHEKKAADVSRD